MLHVFQSATFLGAAESGHTKAQLGIEGLKLPQEQTFPSAAPVGQNDPKPISAC
jgi:hypothetical protein